MGIANKLSEDVQVVFQNLWSLFVIVLNIVSSISIVVVNKWVFVYANYTYGTTLTIIHFIMTWLGLYICAKRGVFEIKKLNVVDVMPLSALFCGFVVLTNLSLQYNTVGFYQVMKVLTTPFIVAVQIMWYHQEFPTNIKLTLLPLCVGVALASATDVQVNFVGTCYALAGVVVTSFYQIFIGTFQKKLGVDSMQLLIYQAPIAAVMLLFVVPIFDDVSGLMQYEYTTYNLFLILLTGVLAFFVNLSIFLVIGKTSPVTYNVVGHFKLVMIILSGFIIFGNPVAGWNLMGIFLTLLSVIAYTHLKLQAQAKPHHHHHPPPPANPTAAAAAAAPSSPKPEAHEPLVALEVLDGKERTSGDEE